MTISFPRRRTAVRFLAIGLALVGGFSSARAEQPYAAEPVAAKASAYLPQSVVNGLDPQGSRLVATIDGIKTTIYEIWWAKVVPAQEKAADTKLLYGKLKTGALVGVVHFPAEASQYSRGDFRNQRLRPGFYTMRYVPMPQDAQHKGASLHGDFLLLSPVSVDRNPESVPPMEELIRMGRTASRTQHPAVFALAPAETGDTFSVVRTDDAGGCIFQVKLHLQLEKSAPKQELGFAVVLITPNQDSGAS